MVFKCISEVVYISAGNAESQVFFTYPGYSPVYDVCFADVVSHVVAWLLIPFDE